MRCKLAFISLTLLSSALLQVPGSVAGNPLSERSPTKEAPANAKQAQTPREYIESRLHGKIIRLKRDPEALLRGILFIERNGSVTEHVLKVELDSEADLREVRIVTPNADQAGFPPVVVLPTALMSPCWFHCGDKCGQGTNCRLKCLFDCIVD